MKIRKLSPVCIVLAVVLTISAVFCFAFSAQALSAENNSNTWLWPTESQEITLTFGEHIHPITGAVHNYDHIYIKGAEGDSVLSAINGTVTETGYDSAYGYYIVVSDNNGINTVYGQLKEILVESGAEVAAGAKIGTVGRTGKVTGNCLSFAVFEGTTAVDPMTYLK